MRNNFDFSDLEAFLAVKETSSFHLATEKLSLSQSANTRRNQKLESALEPAPCERDTLALKPKLAAKRLQDRAEAILGDAQDTTMAMRDESVSFTFQRNAVVTVAIIPSAVPTLMPRAIRAFRASGHATRIRLMDHATKQIYL